MSLWEGNNRFISADPDSLWESAGKYHVVCVASQRKWKAQIHRQRAYQLLKVHLQINSPKAGSLVLPVAYPSGDSLLVGPPLDSVLDSSLDSATSYCVSLGQLQTLFESVSLTVTKDLGPNHCFPKCRFDYILTICAAEMSMQGCVFVLLMVHEMIFAAWILFIYWFYILMCINENN